MEKKGSILYIGEGVLRGFFLTLVLILILSAIASFATVSSGIRSICMVVFTCLSVIYGAVYSTKKIRQKGWIVGIAVGLLYIVIIYLVSIIAGSREAALTMGDLFRVVLAILVGSLSGMLGINL